MILKPEWATNAVYTILDSEIVRNNNGVLSHHELNRIWLSNIYPISLYPRLLELMEVFDLAIPLPDGQSHLIPEQLPSMEPDYAWEIHNNLRFFLEYSFIPPSLMSRFIVRILRELELQKHGNHLYWRDGAILRREGARALVKIKHLERTVEICIVGRNKRRLLTIIRREFEYINESIQKAHVKEEVPCDCLENCKYKFDYSTLIQAELQETRIQCQESLKLLSPTELLNGYEPREYGEAHRNQESVNTSMYVTNSRQPELNKNCKSGLDIAQNWNNHLAKDFHDCLLDAFESESLTHMLRFSFNLNLRAIVASRSFSDMAFDLIEIARREGWIHVLVQKCHEYNSGNQKLASFVERINQHSC